MSPGYGWKPFTPPRTKRHLFYCDVCGFKSYQAKLELPAEWSTAVIFGRRRDYCPTCTGKADGEVGR